MKQENVLDEVYRKAGKMDSECFAPTLNLFHTDLIKIIRDYLLKGTQSTKSIKAELYKLNVEFSGVDTRGGKRAAGGVYLESNARGGRGN